MKGKQGETLIYVAKIIPFFIQEEPAGCPALFRKPIGEED
jgi:hypothetical protein